MAEENVVLLALLEWLNSLREEKVHSIEEISSGTILWEVLGSIDPELFSGDLPLTVDPSASEPWVQKLQNLKHIHDALTTYIVDRCRRELPLPSGTPDLEAIAQSTSAKDASQLLKLVLLAAVFGRFSMDFIQQLISFSEETQAQFYMILEEPKVIEEEEESPSSEPEMRKEGSDERVNTSSGDGEGKDPEVVYEERIVELIAANKRLETERVELKEQIENMHDLHTRLQKSYDSLEIRHQDTAERLDALRTGKGEQSILNIQRTKMQQQETVIVTLEHRVTSLEEENNSLKVQTEQLQTQTEDYYQMKEEFYALKLARDQMQRKANAAEKYRQKLESLREIEDENEALKGRVTEMQQQLKKSDADEMNISELRRENDELKRLVSNIEQSLSDSNEAKKRAEFEKLTLQAKLQQADDQATRWHSRAEELQRTVSEYQSSESPTTPRQKSKFLDLEPSEDGYTLQDIELDEGVAKMQLENQDVISEEELQTILSIMKAHVQSVSNAEKTSSIQEQQKLAAKIESSRTIIKQLNQVIDYLAQSRVEFVGVKELDGESPYKPVSPDVDDLAATYGLASRSARSSVTSLSQASRRSSAASFHSIRSTAAPRENSMLRGIFGSSGNKN